MSIKPTPQMLSDLFRQNKNVEIINKANAFRRANAGNETVMMMLGVSYAKAGDMTNAIADFNRALRINPKSAQAHNNLANAQRNIASYHDALVTYDKAIALNPDYFEAHNGRASVLMDLGRIDEAVSVFRDLHIKAPDDLKVMLNLGQGLISLGEFDEAQPVLEAILNRDPAHADAHFQLNRIIRYTGDEDHINQMKDVLKAPKNHVKTVVLLNYALGKAHADMKDTNAAGEFWQQANATYKDWANYDFDEDQQKFDRIASWSDLPQLSPPVGKDIKTPIFIVGMPRSGTSLVEQILSGHDKVYAAGELETLGVLVKDHALHHNRLSKSILRGMRDRYLDDIGKHPTSSPFITDKMPVNFRWVGLIRAMMPDAPIIHLKRHPMAICFSNWRHFFIGMRYTHDLEDIGRYYLAYDELMQRFEEQHGDAIISVDYEALTASPREHIETLLSRLGFDWQESCLKVEDNKRSVKTVSNVQIRQKIYTKSSEEWMRYEHHLGPLKNILMPVLERDGWL